MCFVNTAYCNFKVHFDMLISFARKLYLLQKMSEQRQKTFSSQLSKDNLHTTISKSIFMYSFHLQGNHICYDENHMAQKGEQWKKHLYQPIAAKGPYWPDANLTYVYKTCTNLITCLTSLLWRKQWLLQGKLYLITKIAGENDMSILYE